MFRREPRSDATTSFLTALGGGYKKSGRHSLAKLHLGLLVHGSDPIMPSNAANKCDSNCNHHAQPCAVRAGMALGPIRRQSPANPGAGSALFALGSSSWWAPPCTEVGAGFARHIFSWTRGQSPLSIWPSPTHSRALHTKTESEKSGPERAWPLLLDRCSR